MSSDPLNPARRLRQRRLKLPPNAACVRCGTTNPTVLQVAGRSLLENHHVFGRAHDADLKVAVCRNCHAIFSAAQSDDEVPLGPQRTLLERVVAILLALASFLGVLVDALLHWAKDLEALVTSLDAQYPDWRRMPCAA